MKKQATILFLTLTMAVMICGVTSAATTYQVGPDPSDDFPTISQAITAATDGDTIQVNPNNGNPYIETVDVTHDLTIIANGEVTVQKPDSAIRAFLISNPGSGSTIQGFNIIKTDAPMVDTGIEFNFADNCNIINNRIIGFATGIGGPGNDNNFISGNTITSGPNAGGWSYGIDMWGDCSNNHIKYNHINSQATGTGNSVGIAFYLNPTATGNQVIGNSITPTTTGTGLLQGILISSSGNTINFNRIIANTAIIAQLGSTIDALYNWYGSNDNPVSKISGANINYNPWLVMTVAASPVTILNGGTSTISVDFRHDSAGGVHDPLFGHFPDDVGVLITSTGGEVGSFSITALTIDGVVTTLFRATQGSGTGTAAGSLDSQDPLSVNINILSTSVNSAYTGVNAASTTGINAVSNSLGMPNTGGYMVGTILAVLMILSGLVLPNKT